MIDLNLYSLPPLVTKYFGPHLADLAELTAADSPYKTPYFLNYISDPALLEKRLQRLEPLGLIEPILAEVKGQKDAYQLDERLRDAWAELRVADQLRKEGFERIKKVEVTADFTAIKNNREYAVQVTRIRTELSNQRDKLNEEARRNKGKLRTGERYGELDKILFEQEKPFENFVWDAIQRKNDKFQNLTENTRCIALVANDKDLNDDNFMLHTECRMIAKIIQCLQDKDNLNFEELFWFPDTSNGALFTTKPLQCFCDWQNEPLPYERNFEEVNRQEIDLNNPYQI